MSKGTSETESGLSAETKTAAEPSFDAIAEALYSGNQAELDRLMAVDGDAQEEKTEKNEETKDETEAVEADKDTENTPIKGEKDSSEEEQEKTEAATSAASTATKQEDIESLKRELHQYKSDAGRVPYLQRRLAELERELRATKARGTTTQKADTGNKPSIQDVELDPDVQKDIDELREIDPVLAKTMERIAKTAVATASAKVDHAVTTLTQQEQEAEDFRFYTEQKARLLEQIPQAEQIFATPEWARWKESLTPARRAMAESGYADEVIQAIYAFAADMRNAQGVNAAPAQKQEQPVTPEKNEVQEARNRKVEASAEVANPSAKKIETFDEEQAFREMYNSLAKKNHIL